MGMSQLNWTRWNKNCASFLTRILLPFLLAVACNSPANLSAQAPKPAQAQAPASAVTLTPLTLPFGTQVVGTTGGSKPVVESVVLKNSGTAPLNISKITLKGDFTQTNNCPTALPAGASCSVDLIFSPTANGVRLGTLEFTDDAADSPQDVSIGGTGSVVNLVHIHLLLNHFPVIGMIIGVGLFLLGMLGKSEDLQRACLLIFLAMALITIPTFLSGSAAADAVKYLPGISSNMLANHLNAALPAYFFIELTGAMAWFGLWEYRRNKRLGGVTLGIVLLLSLITIGLMSNTGNLGGKIRHEEIMYASEVAPTSNLGTPFFGVDVAAIGAFVRGTKWVWPTLQTLHFIGLSLLLGVVFMVDLRLLGLMKNVAFSTVHRLLPWGVLGFGLNVFTGMCYWVAAPYQYTLNIVFYWKIIFILVAGINTIYLTAFDEPYAVQADGDSPFTGKVVAASMVALWVGVIFCGIMLPFLGSAF